MSRAGATVLTSKDFQVMPHIRLIEMHACTILDRKLETDYY